MPPLRRLLFAAVAIVALAAAASWIAQSGPRKFGEPLEIASVEPAAQPPQAVQPRRGAGTVGARAGSLGAVAAPREYETGDKPGEYKNGASQQVGAEDVPRFGRAPRPSPKPNVPSLSTDAQPDETAEIAWSGRGVEELPPPTPGRDPSDPSDSESTGESDAPPDPTSIAGFPSDPPAPRAEPPTTPRSESPSDPGGSDPGGSDPGGSDPGASDPGGSHESPSDPGESVTADAPLTPEQIDNRANQQLAGLPPEQADPLKPIVVEQITTNSDQAFGWTTPKTD